MCNISYGIAEENYNEGWQGGMNKGRREGRREGKREGVDEARLEGLRNLMKTLRVDFDHAADLLLIPKTEREKYRKLING